jgi:dUTP pyrophosphatase
MTVANPKLVLEHVSNLIDAKIQETVHGLDLTVKDVLILARENKSTIGDTKTLVLDFDNKERKLPQRESKIKFGRGWELAANQTYVVVYNEFIKIPSGYCGMVLPRSTLLRGFANLSSALWDAGYEGRGEGLLTTGQAPLFLHENARVGQMIFLKADTEKKYEGTYQRERARVWTDGSSKKEGSSCSFMVEGSDGVVVFPLPKGTTNNQAEYMGVIKALTAIKAYDVDLYSDSEIVVFQINTAIQAIKPGERKYECRDPILKKLLERVIELQRGRKVKFSWNSRDKNKAHTE